MAISLLYSNGASTQPKIDPPLFSLIRLDTLLSENTQHLLSVHCTAEDIRLRQAVFARMEAPSFRADLEQFFSSLTALWQANNKLKDAKNECEELLGFYTCARRFINCTKSAQSVAQALNDDRFRDFYAYCQDNLSTAIRLEPAVLKLESPVKRIRTSLITFQCNGVWLDDDNEGEGILNKVTGYAANLGLSVSELPKQRCLAMPHELSESLMFLYPNEFEEIRALAREFAPLNVKDFLRVREELNFFFNIYELIARAGARGIPHCIPSVSDSPVFRAKNAYDITLINVSNTDIIPNDIDFRKEEPFSFLIGANGGGKTTYLRTVCANLILAGAGCPMFADNGEIGVFPFIGAHFPTDETPTGGKLFSEQQRENELLNLAKNGGFLFFNETFSGANDRKGVLLTLDCAAACVKNGIFALFVTHFHEVVGHRYPILSTVVETENDNRRTYRITKNPGTKSSYAEDILRKYRLSADTFHLRGVNEQ